MIAVIVIAPVVSAMSVQYLIQCLRTIRVSHARAREVLQGISRLLHFHFLPITWLNLVVGSVVAAARRV